MSDDIAQKQYEASLMTDDHILRKLNYIWEKSVEGFRVFCGGCSIDGYRWREEQLLYGEDALDYFCLPVYVREAKKRGIYQELFD